MSNFMNNSHDLIKRSQTFSLERKCISIHSEDRDMSKYKNSNSFEVTLPETLKNVQTMCLAEISLPTNLYVFSNNYQNTKFKFSLRPSDMIDSLSSVYTALNDHHHANKKFTAEITSGSYNPQSFASEIQLQMNNAVNDYIYDITDDTPASNYDNFQVHFDSISQQLYIGNNRDEFELNFDLQCDYDDICSSGQPEMWNKSRNWGLPYNMGYERQKYDNTSSEYKTTRTGIPFSSRNGTPIDIIDNLWLLPDTSQSPSGTEGKSYYYIAPFPIQILCDETIYMELEKYNTLDELMPYSNVDANLQKNAAECVCLGLTGKKYGTATSNKICSQSQCPKCQICPTPYSNVGGRVNAAFAKIPYTLSPILPSGANYRVLATKGEIQNVSSFSPPLDSVSKLKIKFRFHDGRLVEFGKFRFDFTLAFGILTDEISRIYETRVPSEYYM
jgi:hypothetical protein